jgi:phosphoglycerate dehydrogenase-like enzyme
MNAPVLLCSRSIWDRLEPELRGAAPGLDAVLLTPGDRITDDDVARITVAFSSPDLYPSATPALMRICLDAPNLQWFQAFSAGVDHPVFGMVRDRGVRLTTASGAASTPIAHHVILCLLALAHDLPGFMRDQQQKVWRPRSIDDVEQRTLGVLGMGPIGAEVARLGLRFGMRAIGMRRTVTGDEPCETWTFERLDELLTVVDDLVLALPITSETRNIIGARELGLMRPGARIVNVGRGELIDEPALVEHLRSGHIGGAALDVFATEPLPVDSALWDMPNVIITPHTSGETALADRRVEALFIDNLGRWARGEPLRNEVGD